MSKKNVTGLLVASGMVLSLGVSSAQAAAGADSLQQVVENGKKLFTTATFDGNGRTCNSCHVHGGTTAGHLPNGKAIPSLANAAAIFPRYDAKRLLVKTLPDQVHNCIANGLQGKPPAYDSAEMTELVVYLTSLSQGKAVDMGGKPQ